MNSYERIFGTGPRGTLISLALLALAWRLEELSGLPGITPHGVFRGLFFAATSLATCALLVWSLRTLPPRSRGTSLITTGAFRYLRHPLYAAFLSCFNFGLALLLNNWIYVVWAILLHGVWHWNIRREERLMQRQFPQDYDTYCKTTGRFVPRLWD